MADLKIKASLDKSAYDKGLDAMKDASKGLNRSLEGFGKVGGMVAGVFGGNVLSSAVMGLFSKFTSLIGDAITKTKQLAVASEDIGVMPEELHKLQSTFERFGATGDDVVSMFGRMAAARDAALGGNKDMIKSFEELGLSVKDLTSLNPDELFKRIAEAYAKSSGSSHVAAKEIFGRGLMNPRVEHAVDAYGRGQTFEGVNAPTNAQVIKTSMAASSWKKTMTRLQEGLGWMWSGVAGAGMDDKEVQASEALRRDEIEQRQKRNAKAVEATKAKEDAKKKALAHENDIFEDYDQAFNEDEINRGLRVDRPGADSMLRKGLVVGGAPADMKAYSEGQRQTKLQEKLVDLARQIEHNTQTSAHQKRLKNIENGRPINEGLTEQEMQ